MTLLRVIGGVMDFHPHWIMLYPAICAAVFLVITIVEVRAVPPNAVRVTGASAMLVASVVLTLLFAAAIY